MYHLFDKFVSNLENSGCAFSISQFGEDMLRNIFKCFCTSFNQHNDNKSEILNRENFRKLFELIDQDTMFLLEKLLYGI